LLSSGLTLTDASFRRLPVYGGISPQNTGSLTISQDGQDMEFDLKRALPVLSQTKNYLN